MSSIHWPESLYEQVRARSAASGEPITVLIRDALTTIVEDPEAAVAIARPHLAATTDGNARPLRGQTLAVFYQARAALDGAFGGTVGVAPVVRGLVAARLARDTDRAA